MSRGSPLICRTRKSCPLEVDVNRASLLCPKTLFRDNRRHFLAKSWDDRSVESSRTQRAREVWDGADAPGGASGGQSPALGGRTRYREAAPLLIRIAKGNSATRETHSGPGAVSVVAVDDVYDSHDVGLPSMR
jgi:hypothetical protein